MKTILCKVEPNYMSMQTQFHNPAEPIIPGTNFARYLASAVRQRARDLQTIPGVAASRRVWRREKVKRASSHSLSLFPSFLSRAHAAVRLYSLSRSDIIRTTTKAAEPNRLDVSV